MRNQNDGSDMIALDERQAQLDAFEAERQAYNMAMLAMPQQEPEPVEPLEMLQEPAPVEPLEMAVGGDASLKALLAQNTETLSDELPEEPPINTDPVGTAQKMLASLTQTKKAAASPTARSIKKSAGKGGASAGKEMDLSYESLTAAKDMTPALKETGSARSQMEALARAYKLRAQAATEQSKGFMRDTMNAPTLDKPNLGRATLAAKRFNEGGEVSEGSSTGFVTGKPIEFSNSPYSPYSIDFVTAKPIRVPLYNTNDQGGGDNNSTLSQQTIDFLDKEAATPGARDARMQGINDLLTSVSSVLSPGSTIARALLDTPFAGGVANFFSPPGSQPNYSIPVDNAGSYAGTPAMGQTSYESGRGNPGEQGSDTGGGAGIGGGDISGASSDTPALAQGGLVRRANGGEVEEMQGAARKSEAYQALEKYLQSRDEMPSIKISGNLPANGLFTSDNLNIGSGTVKVGKDTPKAARASVLAHELTHAADRQMRQQAIEQSMFGKKNQYTEAYEKLVGQEGRNRTEFVRRRYPEYEKDNRNYRASSQEVAAHGTGAFVEPTMQGPGPLHIDATAATELQILLDLAQRNVDKGPKGLSKIPAFLRKMGRYSEGGEVEYRAKGSPEEGELTQEQIDAASKVAFRTSKSGIGRPEGDISRLLRSGDAYVNMAKGLTEMPYNLAGAPMDLVMLARQGLTGQAPAGQVGTSDYLKQKATELGIRQAPPTDPTAKGFYTAGDLLSNLVNPASVPRKVGPAIEKGVKAGATEVGRQLDRAIMDNAGPLARAVPDAARPMYAVRPTGSMTSMNNPVAADSRLERIISDGRLGEGVERTTEGMENFWNVKARNYFEKQFGTPDDPIADALKAGRIKSEAVQATDAFPNYLTDQLSVGRTRTREGERPEAGFVGPGAPSTRFFPKYPQAMEEFTSRYDAATGLKGDVVTTAPGMGHDNYPNMLSPLGNKFLTRAEESARERLAAQGVREELANTNIELTARSEKDPTVSTGYSSQAKALLEAYEKSKEKPSMLSRLGLASEKKPEETLSQSVVTAIEKGEPIYETTGIKAPLKSLFSPTKINKYLETLSEREVKKVRFEDVVQGANKMFAEEDASRALADRIRNGKNVPDKVFSDGVSSPLLQFDKKSGFEGYAWKRIETPEATVPEGAYLGHSVGGYKLGGATYSKEKMQDFKDGRYQVYTLRDNRNRPVTTVEVKMIDEYTPAVMQVKGNGRASGNIAPEDYDRLVLNFFENYLHPAQISEKDTYLTPLLQQYKEGLNANFKMP